MASEITLVHSGCWFGLAIPCTSEQVRFGPLMFSQVLRTTYCMVPSTPKSSLFWCSLCPVGWHHDLNLTTGPSGSTVGNPPGGLLWARQQTARVLWQCFLVAICHRFFWYRFSCGPQTFFIASMRIWLLIGLWLLALFCHIAQGGPPEVHETAASSSGSYGGMGLLNTVNVFLSFNKEVRLTVMSYLLHDMTICARLVVFAYLCWAASCLLLVAASAC